MLRMHSPINRSACSMAIRLRRWPCQSWNLNLHGALLQSQKKTGRCRHGMQYHTDAFHPVHQGVCVVLGLPPLHPGWQVPLAFLTVQNCAILQNLQERCADMSCLCSCQWRLMAITEWSIRQGLHLWPLKECLSHWSVCSWEQVTVGSKCCKGSWQREFAPRGPENQESVKFKQVNSTCRSKNITTTADWRLRQQYSSCNKRGKDEQERGLGKIHCLWGVYQK